MDCYRVPHGTTSICQDPQQQHLSHLRHCLQVFLALLAAAADGNVSKLRELLKQPHRAKHINSTDEEHRYDLLHCCTNAEICGNEVVGDCLFS